MKLSEKDGILFLMLWNELIEYVSIQKDLETPLLCRLKW